MSSSKSIISNKKECYICGHQSMLHKHHIWYGIANRKKADQDGLWCYLCTDHDIIIGQEKNGTPKTRHIQGCHEAIHSGDREMDILLKGVAKDRWKEVYNKTDDDFKERYGEYEPKRKSR